VTVFDQIAATLSAGVDEVGALDGRFLLPALALQLGNLLFRSLVWRNVLVSAYPDRRVPVVSVAASYAAGAAINAFTPARGGDLAKLLLVRTRIAGSTLATIASSLSVVLLLDGAIAAVLVTGLWAFGILPTLPTLPSLDPRWLVVAGVAGLVLALASKLRTRYARALLARIGQGLAILRSPRRYVATVVPFQLAAWACRIGVVFLVLAAFHIHVGLSTAALLVVLNGVSTAAPVPGGAGTQQVLAAYALQGVAPVAQAVSFSVSMQLGITIVNTAVGLAAAMLLLGTYRPLAAVRSSLELVRAERGR
jgi:uncharacterized membrane protein YbhN (UPF0104 family)